MVREGMENESQGKEGSRGLMWLLVDHSSREEALSPLVEQLRERQITVELVTISEVIGSAAREAFAGGAERILRGLRVAMRGRSGDEDLVGAIRRRRPDVLVVTEPRYVRAIGVLENLTGVASLQVGLVRDLVMDGTWYNGQLHAFVVPEDRTKQSVVDEGYSPERVLVAGPAVRPGFLRPLDRDKIRQELGLREERVILVRADGIDLDRLEKLVFQATLVDGNNRFIFHHDGDGATASTLRRAADQYGLGASMFGRVPDLERYMAAADAVLATESDNYLAELLALEAPTLVIPSARGERGNGEVLAAMDLAWVLDDIGTLGSRLERFLEQENLDKLRQNLASWGAAERQAKLVDALDTVVENGASWRRISPEGMSQAGEEQRKEAAEAPLGGAFEPIGTGGQSTVQEPASPGGKAPDQPFGRPRPDYRGISRAEAQEQLAQLILNEREQERKLQDLEKQQERWRGRLELAREWNEADLAREAEEILRGYIEEAGGVISELDEIRRQKEKLKSAARQGGNNGGGAGAVDSGETASRLEERFREMEVDRDLKGLRDRIKRELGE